MRFFREELRRIDLAAGNKTKPSNIEVVNSLLSCFNLHPQIVRTETVDGKQVEVWAVGEGGAE